MARKKIGEFSVTTIILVLIVAVAAWWFNQQGGTPPLSTAALNPGDYLLCCWNVENFFDNVDDPHNSIDDPYDNWFAQEPETLRLKLERITEVLLSMNQGKGPDIISLVEVEGLAAGELIKTELNRKLPNEADHYKHVVMKEVRAGRHIAPVIITRLPIVKKKTFQIGGKRQRTVEGHIQPKNAAELIVIASHWTSRRSDGEDGRARYAKGIYGRIRGMWHTNPNVDVLVCGDLNDTPDDISLTQHLKATGDLNLVRQGDGSEPRLFNLMAGKNPSRFGTHYYSGWHIFDQIIVSPGMLDNKGWSLRPSTVTAIKEFTNSAGQQVSLEHPGSRNRRPWKFGSRTDRNPRGYSDHFPVTVVLTLHEDTKLARAD